MLMRGCRLVPERQVNLDSMQPSPAAITGVTGSCFSSADRAILKSWVLGKTPAVKSSGRYGHGWSRG
jgi:hypothetical protein